MARSFKSRRMVVVNGDVWTGPKKSVKQAHKRAERRVERRTDFLGMAQQEELEDIMSEYDGLDFAMLGSDDWDEF